MNIIWILDLHIKTTINRNILNILSLLQGRMGHIAIFTRMRWFRKCDNHGFQNSKSVTFATKINFLKFDKRGKSKIRVRFEHAIYRLQVHFLKLVCFTQSVRSIFCKVKVTMKTHFHCLFLEEIYHIMAVSHFPLKSPREDTRNMLKLY